MKISSTMSGTIVGPAGDKRWGPVDTTELGDKGKEMETLVESVGFFELSDFPISGNDVPNFTIEVVDGDRHHRVTYSDPGADVPPGLKELQALIEEVAPSS
jgi:hypothetical protein